MDEFYQGAYKLVSSKEAREAFALDKEPAKVRDQYGRNQAGQRMLLARRLVEAGVRFVSLTYGGWDHHNDIKNGFGRQAPPLDKAYATLLRDLDRARADLDRARSAHAAAHADHDRLSLEAAPGANRPSALPEEAETRRTHAQPAAPPTTALSPPPLHDAPPI